MKVDLNITPNIMKLITLIAKTKIIMLIVMMKIIMLIAIMKMIMLKVMMKMIMLIAMMKMIMLIAMMKMIMLLVIMKLNTIILKVLKIYLKIIHCQILHLMVNLVLIFHQVLLPQYLLGLLNI